MFLMGGHSYKSHTKHWGKAKSGVVKATSVFLVENFSEGKVFACQEDYHPWSVFAKP